MLPLWGSHRGGVGLSPLAIDCPDRKVQITTSENIFLIFKKNKHISQAVSQTYAKLDGTLPNNTTIISFHWHGLWLDNKWLNKIVVAISFCMNLFSAWENLEDILMLEICEIQAHSLWYFIAVLFTSISFTLIYIDNLFYLHSFCFHFLIMKSWWNKLCFDWTRTKKM